MKSLFLCLILGMATASAEAPLGKLLALRYPLLDQNESTLVLVTFTDKGNSKTGELRRPESLVSERALRRRLKVRDLSRVVDAQDLPLEESYVARVTSIVGTVRHRLKWFNAVSALATREQIDILRTLPFVAEVELVGRWKKRQGDELPVPFSAVQAPPAPLTSTPLDYGTSITQVNQINIPAVHNLGYYGQGVVVGVFDNGFRNLAHQAFDSMHIIATYDFVDHKVDVKPNNPGTGFGSHGVWTLSTIGGFRPGQLIGPAFKSNFILARTENDSSETPIEEDNWAAAIQWADSIGVDVTSTSLGYLTFDSPYPNLSWQDMNGHTALITNAADRAVGLGIVVVNSAGNSGGGGGGQNTLIAPADGDSVISAGAVTSSGVRTSFSSVGPTTDIPPRIKPDIMAMGQGVKAASATDTINYVGVSGTSFSCPLSAGVAALILCANPSLTPMQVRDAMRQTANNSCAPNNLVGWGVLNALAAVNYNATPPQGSIAGTIFNDLNGNGSWDGGEPGLSGIRVRLSCSAAETTFTNGNGSYAFNTLSAGSYTVTEDLPAGWMRTYPAGSGYSIIIDSTNLHRIAVDFGNFLPASISGLKFNDYNGDGMRDPDEPGIPGWPIRLAGAETLRTVTDSLGYYRFTGLGPGAFAVQETARVFWYQSRPAGIGSYSISIRSGLDTTGLDFGNYYAPPSGYPVTADWNLLSLPKDPPDHSRASIYPVSVSRAFSYTSAGGYAAVDPIPNGVGYWIKFRNAGNVPVDGTLRTLDTVDVFTGWNLIGTLSDPFAASSIVQIPKGIVASLYFGYHGSYLWSDTLFPHQGYFVKANGDGKLVLSASGPAAFSGKTAPAKSEFDGSACRISIRDTRGVRQDLYFGTSDLLASNRNLFALPPAPPEGAFDARFSNGSLAWVRRAGDASATAEIVLRAASYPLTISWNMAPGDRGYSISEGTIDGASLNTGGRRISLDAEGTLTVSDSRVARLRLEAGPQSLAKEIPKEYKLEQNYPNPFNPTTDIAYQIPAAGRVKLEVFNVIGKTVRLLVDADQPAGSYTAGWDGRSSEGSELTSGVYYVRLAVVGTGGRTFSSIIKTILMR